MKENDNLPKIISIVAIIIFLVFIFTVSRPTDTVGGLQGGDIKHAIETGQR